MVIITKNSKLPVFKIISASFHLTAPHYKTLLKLAIPLIVLPLALIALSIASSFMTSSDIELHVSLSAYLFSFLSYMLLVMVAVGFHRAFLLSDKTKIFRWGWTETKYLGWATWSVNTISYLDHFQFEQFHLT